MASWVQNLAGESHALDDYRFKTDPAQQQGEKACQANNKGQIAERYLGELALRADIAASTIRYYERCGLLSAPPRRSNWRRYAPSTLLRLSLIRHARETGLSIREIKTLLQNMNDNNRRQPLKEKHSALRAQAARLARQTTALERAIACSCADLESCDLLAEVTHNDV